MYKDIIPDIDEWEILRFHQIIEEDTAITVPKKSDFIGLCFNLGASYRYTIQDVKSGTLYKGLYNFVYLPSGSSTLKLRKGEYEIFCIHFTPAILKKISEGYPMLVEFLKCIEQRKPVMLSNHNVVTTPKLSELIFEALQNRHQFTEPQKRIPEHPKVIDLLFIGLENIEHQRRASVTLREAGKIMKVYDYLVKNSNKRLSVRPLADMAEMTTRRFEKCFKILYRKTVHQVHMELRLKKALALLRDTPLSVREISLIVGYKEVKRFSEAFKRLYGRPPGGARKG